MVTETIVERIIDAVQHHAEAGWCPACGAAVEQSGDHHATCPIVEFLEGGQANMNDSLNRHVAERIRMARQELGLSQSDVAVRLNPSRTYAALSDIENGKTAITVNLLAQVAEVLGKPILWFLGYADPTTTDQGPRADITVTTTQAKVAAFTHDGLADCLCAAADYLADEGQFAVWDVTASRSPETHEWIVTVYENPALGGPR